MKHEQISMFELFVAPVEDAPQMPAGPAPDAVAVPVLIQASTIMPEGKSFRVYGIVRDMEVIPSAWSPSARDVLSMFPVIREYYMARGLFDRGCSVRLNVHEVGADGALLTGGQTATIDISAGELCDAVESF